MYLNPSQSNFESGNLRFQVRKWNFALSSSEAGLSWCLSFRVSEPLAVAEPRRRLSFRVPPLWLRWKVAGCGRGNLRFQVRTRGRAGASVRCSSPLPPSKAEMCAFGSGAELVPQARFQTSLNPRADGV